MTPLSLVQQDGAHVAAVTQESKAAAVRISQAHSADLHQRQLAILERIKYHSFPPPIVTQFERPMDEHLLSD